MTVGAGPTCALASPANVAAAFAGRIGSTSVRTSGTGNALCVFTLLTSNIGQPAASGGTVTLSLNAATSAAEFSSVQGAAGGAKAVTGVGDAAYYVGSTSSLQFLRGTKSVSMQAAMSTTAGTQYVDHIQGDLVALAKVVAAQL